MAISTSTPSGDGHRRKMLRLFNKAKKCSDILIKDPSNTPEHERCINALNALSKIPISFDLLMSTHVGKKISPLKTHPSPEISSLAKNIQLSWKKAILQDDDHNKNEDQSQNPNAHINNQNEVKMNRNAKVTKASNKKMTVQVKSPVKEVTKPKEITNEKKRNTSCKRRELLCDKQTDQNPCKKQKQEHEDLYTDTSCPRLDFYNDPSRKKVREILEKHFQKAIEECKSGGDAYNAEEMAGKLEKCLWDKLGFLHGIDKEKYKSILFNLRDSKNPDFRRKVLMGEIPMERVACLTSDEMASDKIRRERAQIRAQKMYDCEIGGKPSATTDEFNCEKCGQRKATYYQMQIRSADEPMTTFVTCTNCNHHWKFD